MATSPSSLGPSRATPLDLSRSLVSRSQGAVQIRDPSALPPRRKSSRGRRMKSDPLTCPEPWPAFQGPPCPVLIHRSLGTQVSLLLPFVHTRGCLSPPDALPHPSRPHPEAFPASPRQGLGHTSRVSIAPVPAGSLILASGVGPLMWAGQSKGPFSWKPAHTLLSPLESRSFPEHWGPSHCSQCSGLSQGHWLGVISQFPGEEGEAEEPFRALSPQDLPENLHCESEACSFWGMCVLFVLWALGVCRVWPM